MTSFASSDFVDKIEKALLWLDVIQAAEGLAGAPIPAGRSRHLVSARKVRDAWVRLGSLYSVVSAEGSFLFLCAEFELAVRTLAEDYGASLHRKVARYELLPSSLKRRNQLYSARLLQDPSIDRFGSLSSMDVVYSLYTCLDPATPDHSFRLSKEALSFVDSNFRWPVIKDLFGDLGVADLMAAVSSDTDLQESLGVATVGGVASFLPARLSDYMLIRNSIVHRRGPRRPTLTDVREAAVIFRSLIKALDSVLRSKYATL